MERNTVTTARELQPGDRFYKCGDKNKKVLQVIRHDPVRTPYTVYSVFARADNERHAQPLKSDTRVVFLRHAAIESKVIYS